MVRKILVIAISGLVVTTGWMVFSSGLSRLASQPIVAMSGGGEAMLDGVNLMEKAGNRKTLEIKAERAVIPDDEATTRLVNFTLVSKNKESGSITLVAEKGVVDNLTKDVSASGNVLVRDEKGRAMITDYIDWSKSKDEITTDSLVRMFGGRFTIRGRGMIINVGEERMRLLSEVSAVFRVTQ